MEFGVRYDRTAGVLTALVCALLLAVPVLAGAPRILPISGLVIAVAFACSPRGYSVSGRTLSIQRWIGNARIPLDDLKQARHATSDDLRGTLRLFGSGGMFGYYGLFRTSTLGKCWWYATNRQNLVVVITGDQTVLVSPEDVVGFLTVIGPGTSIQSEPKPASGLPRIAIAIGIAVGVVGVAVTALALLYAPGPPRVTLTRESLTIHDRFYPVTVPAAEVDLAAVRVVDITTDSEWRPTRRTNGFANSHYRSGWFQTANGQEIRMYRADGTRLVLLPPKAKGTAVLLEVEDLERFIEDLRRQWR